MNYTDTKVDYCSFDRVSYRPDELHDAGPWDILLSAYDETIRVQKPFRDVPATLKWWVVNAEYGLEEDQHPEGAVTLSASFDPPSVLEYVRDRASELTSAQVCIDATGFIRPHLLVLLWALRDVGVRSFDVLYSDPLRYIADEHTEFTTGPVVEVKGVPGYEGLHRVSTGMEKDILVIGSGYDYEQIARACEYKRNSKKYVLTGLPSLQPHMYQENILRVSEASESLGHLPSQRQRYASANHPFAVAEALHELTEQERQEATAHGQQLGNLYFCPTGPKPHVLGFALYYLRELEGTASSIIYPFARSYEKLTTQGILRTWQYRIEL